MKIGDTIALSFKTIRNNKLRTAITVLIMALGIMALISIITAIEAINTSLTESFSTMGANAFSIRYRERNVNFGGGRSRDANKIKKSALRQKKSSSGRLITYEEAKLFKQQYTFPAKVSIAINGPRSIIANTGSKKTNPDINLLGGDENYLSINGYEIALGRNFSEADVETGNSVCILGNTAAQKLFGSQPQKAVDHIITVAGIKYRVIGVLKNKGSSAFLNADKNIFTTYNNIRRLYATASTSFNIAVMVPDLKMIEIAVGEAKGTFRPIRKLDIKEEDNFYIDKSDSIAAKLMTNLGFLKYATLAIALITLIGAAIGLMNIMLVAVNERTKEIGLVKSIGGKSIDIRRQFLWEAILISLLGAVLGIVLGIALGNVVAILVKSGFVVPWLWVIIGIIVCSLVGLMAGLYPAYKAAKLDPIVALRYE